MDSTSTTANSTFLAPGYIHLRPLFQHIPVGIAILRGPAHSIEFANDAMLRFWERPDEDILNRPVLEVFPAAVAQGFGKILDQVYETGEPYTLQEVQTESIRNNVVRTHYLNLDYFLLRDAEGALPATVIILNDVTATVLARKATEENEERLRLARNITNKKQSAEELLRFEHIAEYSHDLIGACDLQGVPIYINPEGLKLAGLEDMQAAQAVKFTDFFFPEDADFVRQELIPRVMREDYAEMEIRLRHFKTQAPIWMNYAVFTVRNDADEIVSVATISRNIDERKKVQKALRLSLERFHLLADSMPQFVWTGDEQGNLDYFNQSVYAYSGLSPEQVAQDGWLQIVHPDDRVENVEKWLEAVASGEVFFMEHRFRRYDGEYRWQLSRALAQKDRDGKVQMWVGTSTDIHEQKTFVQDLENQVYARTQDLRDANEELERMNRELTAFAYTSSHDLQAPLRKIQAFGSRLIDKEGAKLSVQGQEYLRRMQNATQQMQTLIEDLLSYSRTGTTEKNLENTNLQALLQEVTNELEQVIYEKQAVIDLGPLPTLRVTPFQFRQLFSNLLGNALKFARKDQPPHIQIRAVQQAGSDISHPAAQAGHMYHHLTVADNGIGFDPMYSARIFEVFQRLHGRHDYSGTGIGLAICKKIVESHHGFITATSVPGEGATFHIYLPERPV